MDIVVIALLVIPVVLLVILLILKKKNGKLKVRNAELELFHERFKGISDDEAHKAELTRQLDALKEQIEDAERQRASRLEELNGLALNVDESNKKVASAERRVTRLREVYKAIKYAVDNDTLVPGGAALSFEEIASVAPVEVNALSIRELRSRYNGIKKDIAATVAANGKRYTTKANAAIYTLMVMGLEAELQNIIYTMQHGKLPEAKAKVTQMTNKYYQVAVEGNQTIAPTLTRFIKELEYLYTQAVETEYEYYVKREAAREQQRALREQMRQEAEERKRLAEEQRKLDAEKQKYLKEIDRLEAAIAGAASEEERAANQARLAEIDALMGEINSKEAEIVKLQNGKAGTVYIISNIGSFGDEVYKIGMTRRLEPQDRVDELSSASVPFPFDVHSFIFSEDAPALETRLHNELSANRVNKVNLHKEFFRVPTEELQRLVERIDPSAIFTVTAAAEQFRQSQSMKEAVNLVEDSDDEDEIDE